MTMSWLWVLHFSLLVGVALSYNVYNLSGKPDDGYYLSMEIGTPPAQFNLLLDTGSSNFAIAAYKDVNASKFFDSASSSTFQRSDKSINVTYTQGYWKGHLGSDMVSLPNGSIPAVQTAIALIQESKEFFENGSSWQGILGMGYASLAQSTTDNYKPLPYFDTLVQGGEVADGFSLLLCGPTDNILSDNVGMGGKLTLGAIDSSQYTGELYTASIVSQGFYQLIITDIKVGDDSLNMDCIDYNTDKTILDSGTTNLRLPSKVFDVFIDKLNKSVSQIESYATFEFGDGFWQGTDPFCSQHGSQLFDSFPNISMDLLHEDGKTISLVILPQQYMRPVVSALRGKDCYKIGITSSIHGTVLGAVLMEGYYIYLDRVKNIAMFGQTTCQPRVANATRSTVTGYASTSLNLKTCLFPPPATSALPTYAVVLICIASFLVTFLLMMALLKLATKLKRSRRRTRSDIAFDELLDDSFNTGY